MMQGRRSFTPAAGIWSTARLQNYYLGTLDAFLMEKELGPSSD